MGSLRAESASLGAGARCRAESSEQRVSTSDTDTVSTAEYGRVRRSACPLERCCWSARVRVPLLGPAAAASTRCRVRGGGWRRAAAARAAGPAGGKSPRRGSEKGSGRAHVGPDTKSCCSPRSRHQVLLPGGSRRVSAGLGGSRRISADLGGISADLGPPGAARARAGRARRCSRWRRASRSSEGWRSPTQSWSAGAACLRARCGEVQGGAGRCGEVWGDMDRRCGCLRCEYANMMAGGRSRAEYSRAAREHEGGASAVRTAESGRTTAECVSSRALAGVQTHVLRC